MLPSRAVQRGERYLSPGIADLLGSKIEADPIKALSRREREVLQLTAEGKTGEEIGERLSIAAKTVHTYRSRLIRKIGVSDITGLVRFAIKQGILHLD